MNGNVDLRQLEEMKRQLMVKMLDKEAFERMARVRLANPQLATNVELYLLQLSQSGKLQSKVSDRQLKEVLTILSEKREFKIKRR